MIAIVRVRPFYLYSAYLAKYITTVWTKSIFSKQKRKKKYPVVEISDTYKLTTKTTNTVCWSHLISLLV